MTTNNFDEIVSGTLVQLPNDDTIYLVGEIYNTKCKLYNNKDNSYSGEYAISGLTCV